MASPSTVQMSVEPVKDRSAERPLRFPRSSTRTRPCGFRCPCPRARRTLSESPARALRPLSHAEEHIVDEPRLTHPDSNRRECGLAGSEAGALGVLLAAHAGCEGEVLELEPDARLLVGLLGGAGVGRAKD